MVAIVRRSNGSIYRQNGTIIRATAASLAAYRLCCCGECCCDIPISTQLQVRIEAPGCEIDGKTFQLRPTLRGCYASEVSANEDLNCLPGWSSNFEFYCLEGSSCSDYLFDFVPSTSGCLPSESNNLGVSPTECRCTPDYYWKFCGFSLVPQSPGVCDCCDEFCIIVEPVP